MKSLVRRPLKPTLVLPLIRFEASHKGSISAEHGVGAMKTHALQYSKSDISIEWMRKIKEMFDPRGIMNPGKVLP